MTDYSLYLYEEYQDQCHEEYNIYLDQLEEIMNADRFSVDKAEWGEAMKDLSSSGGIYLFPEPGHTRVRLLLAPERIPTLFWEPVVTTYYEKARTRMMMPVLVLDEEDRYGLEIKWMICAKTVLEEILNLLFNGYDLLSPEGVGIIITRTGEGLGTRYKVLPTKDPVPVDYDSLEWPGILTDAGKSFENSQGQQGDSGDEDDIPF